LDLQMRAMIRKQFHYDLPLAQLFHHPCIAELAKLLEPAPEQLPSSVSVEIQPPATTTTLPRDRKDNGLEGIQPPATTTTLPKDRKDSGLEGIQPPTTTTTLPKDRKDNGPVKIQPRTTTTTLPKDRKDDGPEGKSAKWIAEVTGKSLDRWIR